MTWAKRRGIWVLHDYTTSTIFCGMSQGTSRRSFLKIAALSGASIATPRLATTASQRRHRWQFSEFRWEEAGLDTLRQALSSGRESAVSLTRAYLKRIEELDREGPVLNSVITRNPDALSIARGLDLERRRTGSRGPLHGIPLLIKDNIDTHDRMPTTAGSLALEGCIAPKDAFLVSRLRTAGAIILGKTNLSEWANFRGSRSTSGWSALGGQTRNPYALDRNPSGSSSGSAVAAAANLCAAAVGTETDGSILSPAAYNGIVGLKPTVGLISRSGVIPISASQDTAGPMARTVADAAILLGAMAAPDEADAATLATDAVRFDNYSVFLDEKGLNGKRLGVVRQFFKQPERVSLVLEQAIADMRRAGATVIDPVEAEGFSEFNKHEHTVLTYEFKAGLNAYLAARGLATKVRSLSELIEFNERHKDRELLWFGQEQLIQSDKTGGLDEPEYLKAREMCIRNSRELGIDAVVKKHRLDALVVPSGGPAHVTDWLLGDRGLPTGYSVAAVAGYPSITVPAGYVHGLPVGIAFLGMAWSESRLLGIAYGFEQHTRHRKPPSYSEGAGVQT